MPKNEHELTVKISSKSLLRLAALAAELGHAEMVDAISAALALLDICSKATSSGDRIWITTAEGKLKREITGITPEKVDLKPSRTSKDIRISMNVSANAYQVLQEASKELGRDIPDVLRLGLALLTIGVEAKKQGNHLVLYGDGQEQRQIIL